MKFSVTTVGSTYSFEDAAKLKKLGIPFKHGRNESFYRCSGAGEVEIATLRELVAFVEEYGEIIFDGVRIRIYDDYVD